MARHVGALLRESREERGLSLRGLAQRAGIGKSTLARWEAGTAGPNIPELEAVLDALRVPEARRLEALGLVRAPRAVARLAEMAGERPPLSGDLLRAMRLRGGRTQTEAARAIGVSQGMLAKWERSEDWPSNERLHALCYALGAQEEELAALLCGRFLPEASDAPPLDWEEVNRLSIEILHPPPGLAPLRDLRFLSLEARLWQRSSVQPSARDFLTRTYALHARFLSESDRLSEAHPYAERTLSLVRAGTPALVELQDFTWMDAVLSSAHVIGRGGPRPDPTRAARLLRDWLPDTPPAEYRAWMLSDMALFMAQAGDLETALSLSTAACRQAAHCDWGGEVWFRECDHARVLLAAGRPRTALSYVSAQIGGFGIISAKVSALLIVAEALLALGKASEAQDCLQAAATRAEAHSLSAYRVRANALMARF